MAHPQSPQVHRGGVCVRRCSIYVYAPVFRVNTPHGMVPPHPGPFSFVLVTRLELINQDLRTSPIDGELLVKCARLWLPSVNRAVAESYGIEEV